MKNGKYLLSTLLFLLTIGFANLALAQDGPRKEDKGASIEGRAGDTNFKLRVQEGEKQPSPQSPQTTPGPQGPAGSPGPQGPSGPSGGSVSGMDPTIMVLIGLGVLAVVIVAIVAASRKSD